MFTAEEARYGYSVDSPQLIRTLNAILIKLPTVLIILETEMPMIKIDVEIILNRQNNFGYKGATLVDFML